MTEYIVTETIKRHHLISIDDEIDAETMLDVLRCEQKGYDSITEGLEEILDKYFQKYGFEYAIRPDFLGTECINVELSGTEGEKIDEIEVKTGE